MSEWVEIHWSVGSIDEARRIARRLVQDRLVACAQIIPWIESVYIWDLQLHTAQESVVFLKTRRSFFGRVREWIEKECSYEVPEILCIPLVEMNEKYRLWLESQLISST